MKTVAEMTAHIVEKSMKDLEFRKSLLADPKAAIEMETGMKYPTGMRIKVIEEDPDVAVLTVPKLTAGAAGELSEKQLEAVAGGIGSTAICFKGTGCVICFVNR